ncbi:hypothetical protein [Nitrosomonas marina]|uniref:Uncharacterized protein n=1 Tax=Nitrosomonas marina TaxID=917 RepID=A0A1H8J244_9PROT|nr:hypothetical protein [Nitrosomonas marina]SEN74048.1 hypothetical protein SAMN05216325_1471 [Nitrosomonas marina]
MAIKGRAYLGSAHKVAITIENSLDYDSDDIQEITLTLTRTKVDGVTTVQFTKSAAEVQIETKKRLMLYIHPGKVTEAGGYQVSINWTDKNGQPHRGTVIENEIIRFYE